MSTEIDPSLRAEFLDLGGRMRRNPLYSRLCGAAADEPIALQLLSQAPAAQRRPVLLLAAIHDVVLRDAEQQLATWYPSVHGADALTSIPSDDASVVGALHRFCLEHRDELIALVTSRSVQTNEVGRSAVLAPAIASSDAHRPRALIELGSSAGLNMFVERYRIRYRTDDRDEFIGPSDATLTLTCDVSRGAPVPAAMPVIATRIGFDRHPLRVEHADDARWLEACVWGDDLERFEQLRTAVELVAPAHPDVRTADLADPSMPATLIDVVASCAHDLLPTITHSWVMAYLDHDAQSALASTIASIGEQRDLDWIVFEPPSRVPGLAIVELGHGDADILARVSYRSGRRSVALLAVVHSHGRWMAWQHGTVR